MSPKQWSAVIATILIVIAAIWWLRQPSYPEVSSPESLRLLRALYTACSSQNAERLADVEREVAKARAANLLGDVEQRAFDKIIEMAKQQQWEAAARQSYRFAADQVR